MEQNIESKLARYSLFFIIYTLVFYIFVSTLKYTLPFVFAFCIALLLKKPTKVLMHKFNISLTIASLITSLSFWAVIILLNVLLFSLMIDELFILAKRVQLFFSSDYNNLNSLMSKAQNNLLKMSIDPIILNYLKDSLLSSFKDIAGNIMSLSTAALQFIINILKYIPYIFMLIIFTIISTYFITKELIIRSSKSLISSRNFRASYSNTISQVSNSSKKMLSRYILSYCFLILMSFSITFFGLVILRIRYSLLLSILCSILDLLPVVGMPFVYIPLCIFYFLSDDYFTAIGLIILYFIVFISRQILEPKVVSSTLNIHPLAILISIFIGLEAGGIRGMIYMIFLVISYTILKQCNIL